MRLPVTPQSHKQIGPYSVLACGSSYRAFKTHSKHHSVTAVNFSLPYAFLALDWGKQMFLLFPEAVPIGGRGKESLSVAILNVKIAVLYTCKLRENKFKVEKL